MRRLFTIFVFLVIFCAVFLNQTEGNEGNKGVSWLSFIRQRENAAWDCQIDADFAAGGRLRPLLDEVREDIRAGPARRSAVTGGAPRRSYCFSA